MRETPSAWTRIRAPDVSQTVSLCSFVFGRTTRPEAYRSSRSHRLKAPQSDYEIISVCHWAQPRNSSDRQFSVDQNCTFPQRVNKLSAASCFCILPHVSREPKNIDYFEAAGGMGISRTEAGASYIQIGHMVLIWVIVTALGSVG
jgi:hypothetical protein